MAEIVDDKIEALLVMPPLVKAQLFRHVGPSLDEFKTVDPELYEPLVALHKVLSTRFSYFEIDSHGLSFNFPESKFEGEGEQLLTESYRPGRQQDTFKDHLTEQQKDQIRREGVFDVPSSMSKIPYKWRVHPWIVKGTENITDDWYGDAARSYHQLRQVEKRLVGETLSLKLNISEFKYYPKRIFNMLVGVRQMRVDQTPDYQRLVEMRFMLHKFQQYYQSEPHALNEHLSVPVLVSHRNEAARRQQENAQVKVNQRLSELQTVDDTFEYEWKGVQRQLTRKYKQQTQEPKEEELTRILTQEKQQRYDSWLKEKLPASLQENIFYLLRIFTIFQVLMAKFTTQKNNARQKIEKAVKENHKIRSRDEYFWNEEVQRQYEPIEKALEEQYFAELKESLKSKLFDEYIQFRKDFDSQLEKVKAKLPQTYVPRRTFHSNYRLFPPYEKLQNEHGDWSLKKHEHMECDTGHHFWKFDLYKMRLYSWTRNSFFWLVANSWVGPFGLRVIFSINQFQVDQNIHYRTGEMRYTYQSSLFGKFMRVMDGIRDSRRYFESQPDTGFFGKAFSRIFNLIECYIFRFLILGVIVLLILYPIAIVINSVLSFVLAITSWLWVPLIEVVCYLFNILIYQFEIDDIYRGNRYSERWFPLISTPLMFVLNVLRIVAYMIGAAVVHPILAVLTFVFAVGRHIWSSATDFVMYRIVRLIARTPNRDTNIAWKISGPQTSRQYFSSISGENIYLLVQANLERLYLQQYRNQMYRKIEVPTQILESTMNRAMSVFESSPTFHRDSNIIYESCKSLRKQFDKACEKFEKRFPRSCNLRNVRFTQEELEVYLQNCNRIVKKFIESRGCIWIFQSRNLEYGDYEELTKGLLRDIFSYEVLEPFEDLDSRFELKESGSRYKEMFIRGLRGDVQLTEFHPSTNRRYRTFKVGEITIPKFSSVVYEVNSIIGEQVGPTRYSLERGMLINQHIQAIINNQAEGKLYDKYRPELFE